MLAPTTIDDDALEALLPLDLVRAHTKTDDVPHVTDDQLRLYRQAAFEAAQLYTGVELVGPEFITQNIPPYEGRVRTVMLEQPAIDGIITLSEGPSSTVLAIAPGATHVRIAPDLRFIGGGSGGPGCTDTCGSMISGGAFIRYRARKACEPSMQADVKVGCLQFIGWLIGNPGDNTDVRSAADVRSASRASGAINTWRRHCTTIGF